MVHRGYRVAAIKHTTHDLEVDGPGTDTWRLRQAGSQAVAISGPGKLIVAREDDSDVSIESIIGLLGDGFDLVLAEGYKRSHLPKIEVCRQGITEGIDSETEELLAVVTDAPLGVPVPQYPFEEVGGLADLIEQKILAR